VDATDFLVREISNRMLRLLGNAEQSLGQLDEGQVWYRAHPRDNAIGNLILHIVGSFQGVLAGIDGKAVARNRPAEFSATQGKSKDELTSILRETIEELCRVIESVPAARISAAIRIQDIETTIACVLVGAVSHLSVHVGQMQFIAKSLLQEAYKESSHA
jgi:hypothetical protein